MSLKDTLQPPRARGIPRELAGNSPSLPSTPACAGNTREYALEAALIAFNPRVRGEYLAEIEQMFKYPLQPPRARGIRVSVLKMGFCLPSTPACAGNTRAVQYRIPVGTFNPRVRGEYRVSAYRPKTVFLQPPRARGIPIRRTSYLLVYCRSRLPVPTDFRMAISGNPSLSMT